MTPGKLFEKKFVSQKYVQLLTIEAALVENKSNKSCFAVWRRV